MFRIAKEPFSFTQCTTSSFGVFMEAAKFQGLSLKWLHDDMEVVHIPRHPIAPAHSSYSYSFPRSSNQQVEWSKLPSFHVLGDSKRLQQVLVNLLRCVIQTISPPLVFRCFLLSIFLGLILILQQQRDKIYTTWRLGSTSYTCYFRG